MAWIEDLSTWTYLGFQLPQLKAVGWLSKEREHPTGDFSVDVFQQLCRLLRNPWAPWVSAGYHSCEFCRFTGGFHEFAYQWRNDRGHQRRATLTAVSSRELIVPAVGCLYISPENIAHYIDSHGYCPPREYQDAVMQCPDVGSNEYKKAFLENGGRELMKSLKQLSDLSI